MPILNIEEALSFSVIILGIYVIGASAKGVVSLCRELYIKNLFYKPDSDSVLSKFNQDYSKFSSNECNCGDCGDCGDCDCNFNNKSTQTENTEVDQDNNSSQTENTEVDQDNNSSQTENTEVDLEEFIAGYFLKQINEDYKSLFDKIAKK